jgi:hypothetical protein
MGPEERFVPRFAAEPPQEDTPYGRWEERLREELLAGLPALAGSEPELGEPGEVLWYPDRSWHGRTYVPATCATSGGYELFGYVRFLSATDGREPGGFSAQLDFTDEIAARNPDWQLDLCDEVIGAWRGEAGATAAMTLVWGHPLVSGARVATAELARLTVDQCALAGERFTLLAPDDYRHDLLEIAVFDARGRELARESLYTAMEENGEEGEAPDGAGAPGGEENGEAPDGAGEPGGRG